MLFTTWLQTWLSRHPLKGPSGVECARFTDKVMAKVRAFGLSSKEILAADPLRRWVPWPRFALAIATAAATIALVVGIVSHSNRQLAKGIVEPHPYGWHPGTPLHVGRHPAHALDEPARPPSLLSQESRGADGGVGDAQLLAALEERDGDLVLDDDVDVLHDELAMADTILLAQQASSDEERLAETLEFLDQLDEDAPSEAASDGADEDWLDELRLLDESDLPT